MFVVVIRAHAISGLTKSFRASPQSKGSQVRTLITPEVSPPPHLSRSNTVVNDLAFVARIWFVIWVSPWINPSVPTRRPDTSWLVEAHTKGKSCQRILPLFDIVKKVVDRSPPSVSQKSWPQWLVSYQHAFGLVSSILLVWFTIVLNNWKSERKNAFATTVRIWLWSTHKQLLSLFGHELVAKKQWVFPAHHSFYVDSVWCSLSGRLRWIWWINIAAKSWKGTPTVFKPTQMVGTTTVRNRKSHWQLALKRSKWSVRWTQDTSLLCAVLTAQWNTCPKSSCVF